MSEIDPTLLRRAITAGFGGEAGRSADLSRSRVTVFPSTGGGAFNTSVQRVSDADGPLPWSVVVKHLGADATRNDWDREASVYADAAWLTGTLPDDVIAPRLLASAASDEGVTLILEDLRSSGPLTNAQMITAARLLSEFNGSPTPPRPWWSAGFLHNEFDVLSDHPERLAETRSDARHEHLRQHLVALMEEAPELLASVPTLPHGPAHLDAYSRNIMIDRTSGTIGLVDWANAGSAPLGTDPATLFVLTLNYLDADAGQIGALEAATIDAMHAGLLDAGAGSSLEQATSGFRGVARLRHLAMMMNALPMAENQDPAVSAIVGKPLDEIIDQWITVGDHLLDR